MYGGKFKDAALNTITDSNKDQTSNESFFNRAKDIATTFATN